MAKRGNDAVEQMSGSQAEIQREGIETGGVPCIVRSREGSVTEKSGYGAGDEGWVDGLNGLLKFNYPFGDEG